MSILINIIDASHLRINTAVALDLSISGKCPWNRMLYIHIVIRRICCVNFTKSVVEFYLDKTKESSKNLGIILGTFSVVSYKNRSQIIIKTNKQTNFIYS